jgi:hypothetical protein
MQAIKAAEHHGSRVRPHDCPKTRREGKKTKASLAALAQGRLAIQDGAWRQARAIPVGFEDRLAAAERRLSALENPR